MNLAYPIFTKGLKYTGRSINIGIIDILDIQFYTFSIFPVLEMTVKIPSSSPHFKTLLMRVSLKCRV